MTDLAVRPGPVLKYPGAKWRLAQWIVERIPRHHVYVEPFFGSGAVFFSKPKSKVEILNDLDSRVTTLFRVIRERPADLARAVDLTPWSRDEYDTSYVSSSDELEDARRFLVRCWMAHGIKVGERSGWRIDMSGDRGTTCVKDWCGVPERIFRAASRLKDAHFENRPALKVIENHLGNSDCFIYADPPYLLPSSNRYYAHRMDVTEHEDLLRSLMRHSGPVLLSGYDHPLYEELLVDWSTSRVLARAEKGRERQEVLWLNPAADEALHGRLF